MECHVCLEAFDAKVRRPKALPCGHTLCLRCVQGLQPKKCPVDNLVFEAAVDKIPDNFTVLQLSSRPAEAGRFWCLKCEKAASERCLEDHAVCSLKRARAEDAAPLLEKLRRGEEGLEKLGEALDASREQLQQEKEGLTSARGRLEDAMGADAATWTEAKQAAALDGLSWDAAQLAADLVDPTVRCRVTLQRGAAGDVAWRGEVRPVGDAAARLLLCGLARRGALQQQDELQGEQRPAAPRWKERANELCEKTMAVRIAVGSKVERGRDWRLGCTDAGTPPRSGTVTAVNSYRDVTVKWDSGSTGTYCMGRDGLYQLLLLTSAPWGSHIASWYHQCLDVNDAAPSASFKEMSTLLTDGRLAQARALVSLPCRSAPTWTQKVLQQVAPHLEGLELVCPQQRHLDLALAMPRLQTLELHCTFEAPLPVVAYPKTALRWLRCGFYPLAAALALVRANAETLEELELVAASKKPYGCPDLAAELRRCGLKKLRRMVLLRETVFHEICHHDKESCEAQKTELWVVFVDSGLTPSLLCSECDRKES